MIQKFVSDFIIESKKQRWLKLDQTKKILRLVFDYLIALYKSSLKLKNYSLNFITKSKDVHCQPESGLIEFSEKTIKGEIVDGASIVYKNEANFYKQMFPDQTKEKLLFWLLIHEVCHLFDGCDNHSDLFYTTLRKLIDDNLFLFPNL